MPGAGARDRASPGSRTRRAAAVPDAGWVHALRLLAPAAFIGLILLGIAAPLASGRVTWTIVIAALPLFFVVAGYHRWRRICPLAFVAQLPTTFGIAGRRRAGRWWQAHGYHVAFGLLVGSLWVRLVATNGDGYAIAVFLAGLALAAVGVGLVYTGKTWCNYVCPVSFVEKLYTEPRGLRDTPNSQCAVCTACRPACPDINEENSYWKEILRPAKRHVFFAFPGVVIAFYGFYYLQSGGWAYYFEGGWTSEVGLVRTAFLPGSSPATAGLFFWPAMPRALAAALTLALGAAGSLALFSLVEPRLGTWLRRRNPSVDDGRIRSMMFSIAAFAAFVGFYSFAGAPTLRLVPGVPHLFQLLVVVIATLSLVRRLNRRQADFAEETLARRILANWRWEDTPPPRDLREAFLIHTIKSQSHEDARSRMADLYKSAVHDALTSGVVSRSEVHRLESLRDQLHISESDHERIMTELVDEEGGIGRERIARSPEKQLQLATYAEALALQLERRRTAPSAGGDAFIGELRAQYGVTDQEHAEVLDGLMRRREGVAANLAAVPASIESSAAAIEHLAAVRSPVARFLVVLLRRRWRRAADGLLQALGATPGELARWREALLSPDPAMRQSSVDSLGLKLSDASRSRLADAWVQAREAAGRSRGLSGVLRGHLSSPDPYVRATAFYLLHAMDKLTEADQQPLAGDEHPVVGDTVRALRGSDQRAIHASSILERMIAMRSIGIFDALEPEDLAQLARAATESWFVAGEVLCHQGEMSDEVFVLLDGEVAITRNGGRTDHVAALEGEGTCIGELAVLDPAPREATVVAFTVAVRVLRVSGRSFRDVLSTSPALSEGIIRLLARRLRDDETQLRPSGLERE